MSSETDGFPSRFVGLDLHKEYVVVAAVDACQQVLLKPRRISLDDLAKWAEGHLGPEDAVVLEATGNAWFVYDLLAPRVGRCVVANPLQVKWIAAAAVKTDPHDALRLARLLAANLIPEVWVPPKPVRELRALIAHRRQLVKQQTRLKNQLHSLLHRHHIHLPPGDPFAARNQDWWRQLDLSPSERLRLHQTLDTLAHVQGQVRQVEQELRRLSTRSPWKELVPFLIQLPGFGLLTAMTVLAAIGDITRFPSAKNLVGYAGLGAGVHHSGQTHRGKGITKQGRRDLRRVLIACPGRTGQGGRLGSGAEIAPLERAVPTPHPPQASQRGHRRHCPQDAGRPLAHPHRVRRRPQRPTGAGGLQTDGLVVATDPGTARRPDLPAIRALRPAASGAGG